MRIPMPSPTGGNLAGLYLDSPSHAFDGKYGLVTDEHREPPTFDIQAFGKRCTQKALRAHGLATDAADPAPEESQGWGDDWDDEDTEEACKAFGVDKWKAFRKARDARKRRAAAKDPVWRSVLALILIARAQPMLHSTPASLRLAA